LSCQNDTVMWIVIAALVIGTLAEQALASLNQKSIARTRFEDQDLYALEEFEKTLRYSQTNHRFSTISRVLTLAFTTIAILAGWLDLIDKFARDFSSNPIVITLVFAGVLGAASSLLQLPFSWYKTFVIEEKFGFNNTDAKTFIADILKGTVLAVILGGGVIALLSWIYLAIPTQFWLLGWIAMSLISIVMFMFGTSVFLPLFNKTQQLPDGDLRTELQDYCDSQGYRVDRLFSMDASKRSSKANAFFSGLGPKKTIVLFDTLIEKLETREIAAVLAHEVGHAKLKHTQSLLVFSLIQSLAIFGLLQLLLVRDGVATGVGITDDSLHASVLVFSILFGPISLALGFVSNYFTRKNEYSADRFALQTYDAVELSSALTKISTDSLATLNPHPLYVAAYYTHPPIRERIEALT